MGKKNHYADFCEGLYTDTIKDRDITKKLMVIS